MASYFDTAENPCEHPRCDACGRSACVGHHHACPTPYTCKGCGGALQARADYCTTCYSQLYEIASCHSCGHPTPGPWLCASCSFEEGRCARCGSQFAGDDAVVEVTPGVACEAPLPSYEVHHECMADGEVLA